MRDRFGIPTRLEFYDVEELVQIVTRAARLMKVEAAPEGAREIARRARGTPRIAGRLLRRVADFAIVEGEGKVTREIADRALVRLGVDDLGLDGADRRYLRLLAENYGGGPVGVETIAAALSEVRDAIEEVIEPFLLQQGLIQRTPRGRMLAATRLDPPRPRRRRGPRAPAAISSRAEAAASAEDRRSGGRVLAARAQDCYARRAGSAVAGCGLEGQE